MILLLNERFLLFLLRNKRNRHRDMGTSDKREVTAPDYFRMERSVIENHMNMRRLHEISGDYVAETILYYICYEHQYNIFGFGRLDPEEFARKFGFARSYLRERHESPYCEALNRGGGTGRTDRKRRRPEDLDESSMTSRIENALFILAHLPLGISVTVESERRRTTSYTPIRVIKKIIINQDKGTGKVTYTYQMDEDFVRNTSNLYLKTNTASLISLRKTGGVQLYHFLLRLKASLFEQGLTGSPAGERAPKFDFLCEKGGINPNQEPKYRKRDLNAILRTINERTELDFEVEWTRDGGGNKYVPVFHFTPSPYDIVGESLYAAHMRKDERMDVLCVEVKHQLIRKCPYRDLESVDKGESMFFEWLGTDTPEMLKIIEAALTDSYVSVRKRIPADLTERAERLMWLASRQDRKDFDKWIMSIISSDKFGF